VADRAGVEVDFVDRLIDADILRPVDGAGFSVGDVRRARFVRNLQGAGVSLDGIAVAVREGTLSFSYLDAAAFDERIAVLSETSFRELSEATGVPLELLKVVREAVGFAEPRPDDLVREDELAIVPAIRSQIEHGFRPVAIERWLRVCGDSLRRVAETETNLWTTEVIRPMLATGMVEADMFQAQSEVGSEMAPLMERAVLGIFHGQQQHAWSQSSVEAVELALERAGVSLGEHGPPAMCFLDITGYTRLAEERGDEAAADVATGVAALVRRTSATHGGEPVKWLGDGVMLYFRDPGQGVLAALEMVDGIERQGLPPAHVGLHAGPVIFQEGDYFGRTVNVAARIADEARPGEVLVSQEVVDAAGDAPVSFTEIGPVELKGVAGPLRLHVAARLR
jgi:adenylate cyclase